ncbi:hypothetical protein QR680_004278 [Steinernema hermaphroditum]|uniref:Aminopeptidase P N-terminal domain-containing protein n=1 Tax=Steinernema hermaphroditum TaxID=289476 RepID=A0AA39HQE3_9BILA|nr:hypothetical protein QR680_004278 [Steinernema hermaphroditum]
MLGRAMLGRRGFSLGAPLRQMAAVTSEEFSVRRARLMESLRREKAKSNDSASMTAMLKGRQKTFSAPDVPHPFRQCSNFRYLTGITLPNSRLVLTESESILFIERRTKNQQLWDGDIPSFAELSQLSGVDRVLPLGEFENFVAGRSGRNSIFAFDMSQFSKDDAVNEIFARSTSMIPILDHIDKLRVVKSPYEQDMMRKTCLIGAQAMNAMIRDSKDVKLENQIIGQLEFEVRRRGAAALAYPPVVAAGNRANTIHYIDSNLEVAENDCILVDAGCDVDNYVSDITRCFPASGRFTAAQRELYDALNYVHEQLLKYAKSERPLKLNDLYLHMLALLGHVFEEIRLFKNPPSETQMVHECDRLCPHHVSHYLGMDIHDTATVPRNIAIQPGVCFTIEPGVYIQRHNAEVREEFRGIGFRIEDDILVTETGIEVLTSEAVRSADDVEELMRM